MQCEIEKIIYPGKSLSRESGKVVLTDEGLPGEIVAIAPVREKKNYIEAKTTAVLKGSTRRTEPRCKHYRICSPYQYIDYDLQVKIKADQIEEILSHSLKTALPPIIFRPSPQIWGYRNKIQLRILYEGGEPFLAYNIPGTHDKFEKIDKCHLASDQVNDALANALKIIGKYKLTSITEILVKESSNGSQLLMALYGNGDNIKKLSGLAAGIKNNPRLRGIVYINELTSRIQNIWGENFIEEKIDNLTFYIGAESFFQINVAVLKLLLKDLRQCAQLKGKETLADLYCGIGTFGIAMAQDAGFVSGVESAKENIEFLKRNLAANNAGNFKILRGRCERHIAGILKSGVDILIIDPPRKGIDGTILRDIIKNPAPLIMLISCNPSTLARDLKILSTAYKITHAYAYDFFPHTPHIETFIALERIC